MIKDIIDEFHEHRLSENHKEAVASVVMLRSRYSFSEKEVITALVNEDFLEEECVEYLKAHENKERNV